MDRARCGGARTSPGQRAEAVTRKTPREIEVPDGSNGVRWV